MKQQTDPHEESEIRPCRYMRAYVSALSDDTLSGPARWYARLHVLHCTRCRAALNALTALRDRLRRLSDPVNNPPAHLTTDRRSALERAMDEMDLHRE